MKIKSLFLTLALAGASVAEAVVNLTPDNFDDLILKSGKPALVEFFAPWCGHCKTLAPIYEELATKFGHAKDKVTIAKVDADKHKDLGQRFGIQGFPTLKWFDGKSDKPEDYKSGRDLDSLGAYITEKVNVKIKGSVKAPSYVEMFTDTTFNATIGGDKSVLVAFTTPWCGHCKNLAPTWEQLALDFVNEPSVVIGKVDAEAATSKQTAKDQGVSSYPTIKWFAAGKTEATPYEGARTEAAFIDFINKEAGTYRAPGGALNPFAGTLPSVDEVIQKILESGSDLVAKAGDIIAAAGLEKSKSAEYYGKVAKKLQANAGYVEKELARIEGILKKKAGALAPEKLDDLTSRSNVLRKFKAQLKSEDKSEL